MSKLIKHIITVIFLFGILTGFSQTKEKILLNEGVAAYQKGEYEIALNKFEEAIAANIEYAKAYYNAANAAYRLGDFKKANSYYDSYVSLLESNNQKAKALYNLGNTYLKEYVKNEKNPEAKDNIENLKKSISAYRNSLRYNPDDEDTRYNLSYAMSKLPPPSEQKDNKNDNQEKDKENKDDNQENKDQKQDQQQQEKDRQKDQENRDQEQKDQENKSGDENQEQKDQQEKQDQAKDEQERRNEEKQDQKDKNNKGSQDNQENKGEKDKDQQDQNGEKPEDQENNPEENKEGQNDQQNDQNEPKENPKDQQGQSGNGDQEQPKEGEISKGQIIKDLDAINSDEQKTLLKLSRQKGKNKQKNSEKDW